jgi:hypothetical protein
MYRNSDKNHIQDGGVSEFLQPYIVITVWWRKPEPDPVRARSKAGCLRVADSVLIGDIGRGLANEKGYRDAGRGAMPVAAVRDALDLPTGDAIRRASTFARTFARRG